MTLTLSVIGVKVVVGEASGGSASLVKSDNNKQLKSSSTRLSPLMSRDGENKTE
jgi:hypothetical protein